MIEEVEKLQFVKNVRTVDNRLLIDLDEPKVYNPEIFALPAGIGGRVQFVNELRHGLENIHLRLIEESYWEGIRYGPWPGKSCRNSGPTSASCSRSS